MKNFILFKMCLIHVILNVEELSTFCFMCLPWSSESSASVPLLLPPAPFYLFPLQKDFRHLGEHAYTKLLWSGSYLPTLPFSPTSLNLNSLNGAHFFMFVFFLSRFSSVRKAILQVCSFILKYLLRAYAIPDIVLSFVRQLFGSLHSVGRDRWLTNK